MSCAACVAAVGLAAWPFTVDDAWIVARYARRIVAGEGYALNGGPPTDGVTGPLWLVPMMLGEVVGIDPVAVAKAAGLACASGAAWIVGGRTSWSGALLLAVQPTLGIWAVAGLETGAATLALTLAAVGVLREPSTGKAPAPRAGRVRASAAALGTAGATAAMAWLRPEGLAACAVLLGAHVHRDRRRAAAPVVLAPVALAPVALAPVALAMVGVLSVVLFRLLLFGRALPLPLEAKPPSLAHGAEYVGVAVLAVTGVVGLLPAGWAVWRDMRGARVLAAALSAHLLAVLLAGGDWMPGYRLLAPALPLYAWLAGQGIASIASARPPGAPDAGARSVAAGARRRAAGVALTLAAAAVPLLDLAVQLPEVRASARPREQVARPLGRWLGERYGSIALVDVGLLGWVSGAEVVDLGGLTDPVIARAPGGHLDKRIDPGYLAARRPDAFVLHASRPPRVDAQGRLETLAGYPVERRLAAMPWVRRHYRVARVARYTDDYHYVVLERAP